MAKIIAGYDDIVHQCFAHYEDFAGEDNQPIGWAESKQDAIDDLLENSELGNVPDDIAQAFCLHLAEEGIHKDDANDYWAHRLETNTEVVS